MLVSMLARRFEDALAAARKLPNELEIQYGIITLREDWAAQNLHFMGNTDGARQAASAALFRLKGLRAELGEDHRIDLAEARIRAIQGADPTEIMALVQKSIASVPADNLAAFVSRLYPCTNFCNCRSGTRGGCDARTAFTATERNLGAYD